MFACFLTVKMGEVLPFLLCWYWLYVLFSCHSPTKLQRTREGARPRKFPQNRHIAIDRPLATAFWLSFYFNILRVSLQPTLLARVRPGYQGEKIPQRWAFAKDISEQYTKAHPLRQCRFSFICFKSVEINLKSFWMPDIFTILYRISVHLPLVHIKDRKSDSHLNLKPRKVYIQKL